MHTFWNGDNIFQNYFKYDDDEFLSQVPSPIDDKYGEATTIEMANFNIYSQINVLAFVCVCVCTCRFIGIIAMRSIYRTIDTTKMYCIMYCVIITLGNYVIGLWNRIGSVVFFRHFCNV